MEEFLPSEIARAVYGYLLSEGCEAAAKEFLETSPNLSECKERVRHGKRLTQANTLLLGKNLIEVLNIACSVHSIVRQIYEKKNKSINKSNNESITELLDQLRDCVLSETILGTSGSKKNAATDENSCSQPLSQPESQNTELLSNGVRTPGKAYIQTKASASSLADNYRSLVQECSEGLDLSQSPDRQFHNRNGGTPHRQTLNRPTSAPGALGLSQLEMENESVIAAITGIGYSSRPTAGSEPTESDTTAVQEIPSSSPAVLNPVNVPQSGTISSASFSQPLHSVGTVSQMTSSASIVTTSTQVMPSCSVVLTGSPIVTHMPSLSSTVSHATETGSLPPPQSAALEHSHHIIEADKLPDPPIIVISNENQPVSTNEDASTSYFNIPPNATSTPHPQSTIFTPEDTAFIIYPPLTTDPPPRKSKRKSVDEKINLRRSGRLRQLLPKPPRQDPPHLIHVKVLPQAIEEEDEEEDVDNPDEIDSTASETELAKKLPNSEGDNVKAEEMDVPNMVNQLEKDEEEKIVESVCTTSDKENISDENLLKKEPVEKLNNEIVNECEKDSGSGTPKALLLRKNVSKSTPRRNSHVRALSFNTPLKPTVSRKANTSPKMPKIKFSPRSAKLSKVKRSSLFKSPNTNNEHKVCSDIEEEEDVEDKEENQENKDILESISKDKCLELLEKSPLYKVPIATRSPAPKLSSAWKEVNDVKITEKPIWDEKIRSFTYGDFIDPSPPPKKGFLGTPRKESEFPKSDNQNPKLSKLKKDNLPILKTSVSGKNSDKSIKSSNSREVTQNKGKPLKRRRATVTCRKRKKVKKSSVEKLESEPLKETSDRELISSDNFVIEQSPDKKSVEENSTEFIVERSENKIQENPATINSDDKTNENTNQLLLDLVLSSNSCFPQGSDEGKSENKSSKESLDIENNVNTNDLGQSLQDSETVDSNKTGCKNKSSPIFLHPRVSVLALETPLKELQVIAPQTPSLNTPLMKVIRQETSVLEEDLLLTPSLPPTPQLNSSPKNLIKTPCKPIGDSLDNQQRCLTKTSTEEILEKTDKTVNKNNLDTCNPKSESRTGKNPLNTSNLYCKNEINNSLSVNLNRDNSSQLKTHFNNKYIKDNVTTASDSSEDEIVSSGGVSKPAKRQSLLNRKECPRMKGIYSTTESSEDDITGVNISETRTLPSGKLSKLAQMLLENERKSLNKMSKKLETSKRPKNCFKKISPQKKSLSSSASSLNSSQENNRSKRKVNKASNKNNSLERIDVGAETKSRKSVTPEIVRQQLQNDLLKRERQMIFGDGFPSSSDSDSDREIFEKKKTFAKKKKLMKPEQQKKNMTESMISFSNSPDNLKENDLKLRSSLELDTYKNNESEFNEGICSSQVLSEENLGCKISEKATINLDVKTIPLAESNEPQNGFSRNITNNIGNHTKTNNANSSVLGDKQSNNTNNLDTALIGNDLSTEINSNTNQMDQSICRHQQNTKQTNKQGVEIGELRQSSNKVDLNKIENQEYKASFESKQTIDLVTNHKNNSSEVMQQNDEQEIDHVSKECDHIIDSNHKRPPTPFRVDFHNSVGSTNFVEKNTSCNEKSWVENEICITSSTTNDRVYIPPTGEKLDLEREDTFEVNGKKVRLTYSQTFYHYLCPKKRIKLTPVGDNEYEQKLLVGYDVIDRDLGHYIKYIHNTGEHINYTTQKTSGEVDNPPNSSNTSLPNIGISSNKTLNVTTTTSVNDERSKHDISLENVNNSECGDKNPKTLVNQEVNSKYEDRNQSMSSRSERNRHNRSDPEDKVSYRDEATYSRHRSSHSERRRRDREIEHKRNNSSRSYGRRDYDRRYSERSRRQSYRKYERRNNFSDSCYRRSCSPKSENKRHESKSAQKQFDVPDNKTTKKPKSYHTVHDFDQVEDSKEMTFKNKINDPRASHIVTYSDVEKNECSRDESESLMDFAVSVKSNKRPPSVLPKNLPDSSQYNTSEISQTTKRKASSSGEGSPNSCQVEKKLKLGEVEMIEAKSVLKHKMVDMLNVLHPDTSNEAS